MFCRLPYSTGVSMTRQPAGWLAVLCALCVALNSQSAWAQPGRDKDPLSWDRNIHKLMHRNCFYCHNASNAKGGLNLAQDDDPRLILEHRQAWETALDMLEGGEMPPGKAKQQPSDEERDLMVRFLKETLNSLDCEALQDPGPPVLRRLNRTEYDLSVLDLTGLDLKLAEGFPPDPSSFGFDNIGEALTLSPTQVENYHNAAGEIVLRLQQQEQAHPREPSRIFVARPDKSHPEREVAQTVITRFATRAFRRPATPETIDRLMTLYDRSRKKSESHEQAIGHMLTAVLISPQFLIRLERNNPDSTEPYLIDDYELASRLSYFLWSAPPDDILLKLASQKKLQDPATLAAQARRMLKDRRSRAFVQNFFGQWFGLQELETRTTDLKIFPEFTPAVQTAIQQEATEFLQGILRDDRPCSDLIDADYSYLNETLAKFYGIPGVQGAQMRRVALKDRRRGGLLTMAAVLTLTSDPGRTNVPRRGNYIADRILGAPPPPPPPDIPALEESKSDKGKQLTVRELLDLHRRNPECASCHAKIDPLGLGLENYNAIGHWRDIEAGQPVNASGELIDGSKFNGPVELKQLLLKQESAFTRSIARNLLIYAYGRGLHAADECAIRDAIAAAEAKDGQFNEMIVSVVQSVPFRYRRNAD